MIAKEKEVTLRKLVRKGRFVTAATVGAAIAYFADPDNGRSRRARAKDQLNAKMRRRQREAEQLTRHAENVAAGQAARARGAGEPKPTDDVDVVHAVKQALSGLGVPTADINVDVVDGTATLRGQVPTDEQKTKVEQAVNGVQGVQRVESWLHLPGQPAPNKASALQAS
ncbi:MAG TPA: BON domain-containing protein [Acidimicrobiales bacterium]|nr:BON domain-containing protein [Acidimicrobiales bacterium]